MYVKGDGHLYEPSPMVFLVCHLCQHIGDGHHLLHAKINICSLNKNQKNIFFFPPRSQVASRAIFSGVTRIRNHNLSLARTLPYHWATLSHVTNNEIFSFYHHFLMSYITCFIAVTISNKKLFNYNIVDLVASYNFCIYFFPSDVI